MGTTVVVVFAFFFQAEDGIRDIGVTGVQTCALPIFTIRSLDEYIDQHPDAAIVNLDGHNGGVVVGHGDASASDRFDGEVGRAACRDRAEASGVAASVKKNKQESSG